MTPPCVGKARLFDSTDPIDHRAAAAICAACPIIEDCRDRLARELSSRQAAPVGTWAGVLVGASAKDKRRRACGTPSGRVEHIKRHEKPCEPCRDAFNAYRRELRARKAGEPTSVDREKRAREFADARALIAGGATVVQAAAAVGWTHDALDQALLRARKAVREVAS